MELWQLFVGIVRLVVMAILGLVGVVLAASGIVALCWYFEKKSYAQRQQEEAERQRKSNEAKMAERAKLLPDIKLGAVTTQNFYETLWRASENNPEGRCVIDKKIDSHSFDVNKDNLELDKCWKHESEICAEWRGWGKIEPMAYSQDDLCIRVFLVSIKTGLGQIKNKEIRVLYGHNGPECYYPLEKKDEVLAKLVDYLSTAKPPTGMNLFQVV